MDTLDNQTVKKEIKQELEEDFDLANDLDIQDDIDIDQVKVNPLVTMTKIKLHLIVTVLQAGVSFIRLHKL